MSSDLSTNVQNIDCGASRGLRFVAQLCTVGGPRGPRGGGEASTKCFWRGLSLEEDFNTIMAVADK